MNKMKSIKYLVAAATIAVATNCGGGGQKKFSGAEGEVRLMIVEPGHFHAALVQKEMYPQVDRDVYVYATEGEDLSGYLDRIARYNSREENPTNWNEIIYTGPGYFAEMLRQKPGNVMVVAGNNQNKTDYILGAVTGGINVLADKPMAIDGDNYRKLLSAFDIAQRNGVLLYDIMTERYEITNIIQRKLSNMPELMGSIAKGEISAPAVEKESVHHFSKVVSGVPLIRPEWFFDVRQQGEGIVDVTTHLVDLVQWTLVGEKPITDIGSQIDIIAAKRWTTKIPLEQYRLVTGKDKFADFLMQDVRNDTLFVYANGEIDYTLNGIHAKVAVRWDFAAPEGAGDTHYAIVKGTDASIAIRQGAPQGYKPKVYVLANDGADPDKFERTLRGCVAKLAQTYPGLDVEPGGTGEWLIVVPQKYDAGHEAHFGQVMQKYLRFLIEGKVPDWEIANMKAKYYVTTRALEIARGLQ